MEQNQALLDRSERQLDRLLEFFPRVDGKASFVFALDTGLLALVFLNLRSEDLGIWYVSLPGGLALLAIVVSLGHVYRCSFPHLDGGQGSLVYFREIAGRTEADFIAAFSEREAEAHNKDVLGQAWRNAQILRIKFDAIKSAFFWSLLALIPWGWFLLATSILHVAPPTIG